MKCGEDSSEVLQHRQNDSAPVHALKGPIESSDRPSDQRVGQDPPLVVPVVTHWVKVSATDCLTILLVRSTLTNSSRTKDHPFLESNFSKIAPSKPPEMSFSRWMNSMQISMWHMKGTCLKQNAEGTLPSLAVLSQVHTILVCICFPSV